MADIYTKSSLSTRKKKTHIGYTKMSLHKNSPPRHNLRVCHLKEEPPEHLTLEISRGECRSATGLRKMESTLKGTHKVSCTGPAKRSAYTATWVRPTWGSWRVSWEGRVGCSSLWGQGDWNWRPQGILISVSSRGGPNFGTKTQPNLATYSPQCWKASSPIK